MIYLFYFLLLIFGLIIGSFLNVLIWRYEEGDMALKWGRAKGRSRCPNCRKILHWYELIPILSFIFQWKRCRKCGWGLPIQYPLVELAGGFSFSVVPLFLNYFFNVNATLFFACALPFWYYVLVFSWVFIFLIFILIVVIDIHHYLIPNDLNFTLAVLGLLITFITISYAEFLEPFRESFLRHYALVFYPFGSIWINKLFGALVGVLFFGALTLGSRGKAMGLGDVKLIGAMGIIIGWPDIVLVMIVSFVIGGIFGLALILRKTKKMKDRIPFAPFLILGFTIVFFFGFNLVSFYFETLNL